MVTVRSNKEMGIDSSLDTNRPIQVTVLSHSLGHKTCGSPGARVLQVSTTSTAYLYEGLTSQALCSGHPFSLFRVSWFNLKASFFVPTRRPHTLSRAGAVKVGRRTSLSPKHRCLSGHALTAPSTSARWYWPGRRLRGEPAFCGAMRLVPHPCIRWVAKTHTHDAIMRIGGEAPRRRAHSKAR